MFDFFAHLLFLGGGNVDNFDGTTTVKVTSRDIAEIVQALSILDNGDQVILEALIDQLLMNTIHTQEAFNADAYLTILESACNMLETVSPTISHACSKAHSLSMKSYFR